MSESPDHCYEFAPFRLHPTERSLTRDGQPIALTPKAFDTLLTLVSRGGHLVEKDELMRRVWPDAFVEEINLTVNISTLRKILGEKEGRRYIETVAKRGYRFIAPVKEIYAPEADLLVAKRTTSSIRVEEVQEEIERAPFEASAPPAFRVGRRGILTFIALTLALAGAIGGYAILSRRSLSAVSGRITTNANALADYEEGRRLWNRRTGREQHQAEGLFQKAIGEDPNFGLAYVGLADCYAFDWPKWKLAEETANKALQIDPQLGEAHATIGFVRTFWLWDFTEAERHFARAIELSPNYATAYQWRAAYYLALGRTIDAKHEMEQALILDGSSPAINADMCQALYYTQEYDAALAQCRKTLALDHDFINTHVYLQKIYAMKGMGQEALEEILATEKLRLNDPAYVHPAVSELTNGVAEGGIRGLFKAQADYFKRNGLGDVPCAESFALAGDTEQAFDSLQRAYVDHVFPFPYTIADPIFLPLRGDKRFERLARYRSGVLEQTRPVGDR